MSRLKIRFLWVVAATAMMCVSASGGDVVCDGTPCGSIVLSATASPSAQFAAEELAAYIKKMSGATLPVTNASTSAGIVIGALDDLTNVPQTVRDRLAAAKSDESFYIKSDGANLFVVGKKPIGALYGTYTLLETYLGVRWFYPGALGEHCPSLSTITLPAIDDFQEPAMASRVPQFDSASYNFYDSVIWCARHKMQNWEVPTLRWFNPTNTCTDAKSAYLNQAINALPRTGGHSLFKKACPTNLFASNPEYFPLIGGVRTNGALLQRCLANTNVFNLVADYGLNWCNANSNNVLSIMSDDSRGTWCQCEECMTMGTVNGVFKVANLYHRFFSRVVDHILARNPDARIDVAFYIDYAVAPDDPTIRYQGKNVRGFYCTCWPHARCYAHGLTDSTCMRNKTCLEDLLAVLKMCPRLYTYEYVESSDIAYAPLYKTIPRDIKDLAALGVEGFMDPVTPLNGTIIIDTSPETQYNWQTHWPALYLSAKLHWNKELDTETAMDEAYGLYYGAAEAPMKSYHALRMQLWESAPGHAYYGGPQRTAYALTVPGAEKELRGYIAEAKTLAAGNALVLERIGVDEQFLDMFWKAGADEMENQFSAEKQIIPERVREPLVIDGDLAEPTWLSARPKAGFFIMGSNLPSAQTNNFRMAYDETNLYVGFVALNDKAASSEVANMTRRDGQELWGDDHIELQLAPPEGGDAFYHIGVNTLGVLYDAKISGLSTDLAYNSQAEVAVAKLDDRFIYEIRLPLAPMNGSVSPGKVWGINALRAVHNLQPPKASETNSLDGNYPGRVTEFRQAVFGDNIIKNGNFSELVAKTSDNTGVIGDLWFRSWGVSSSESEALDDGPRPARLRLKIGTIYSYLQLPKLDIPGGLVCELHASGTGRVKLWTKTCLRPPTNDAAFKSSMTKTGGTFNVSATPSVFRFTIPIAPYEIGYIYLSLDSGEVVVSHLSGVLVEHAITFPAIPDQVVTNKLGLYATASSGLAVSFTLGGGPAILMGGTNLSFTGSGTVSIVASQAGDTNWAAAPNVTNRFNVLPVVSIGLSKPALSYAMTYGCLASSNQTLVLTNPGQGEVAYSNKVSYGSGAGWFTIAPATGQLASGASQVMTGTVSSAGLDVGVYVATNAIFAVGTTNSPQYLVATLAVNKANQEIKNFTPANGSAFIVTSVVGLAAQSSSGLPVTDFTVISGPGVIRGGTLTFTNSGVVKVKAAQAGDANWNASVPVTNTFNVGMVTAVVTLTNLNQTYDGTPRVVGATTLPGGLSISITYNESSLAPTAAGKYAVMGVVNSGIYQGSAQGTLSVKKADQVITFPAIPDQVATGVVGLCAMASSGLPVAFAPGNALAQITGLTDLTFTGAGLVSILALQAGNANWNPAPNATNRFNVTKAPASVTLNNLSQTYNGAARIVTGATVPTGLTVRITYDGSAIAPVDAGNYAVIGTIDAAKYTGTVGGRLAVAKANQAIAFPAIPDQAVSSVVTLSAAAGSGLPVTFAIGSGPGVIRDGTQLGFTGEGSVKILADQSGNANWNAAASVTATVAAILSGRLIAWGNNANGQCNVPAEAQGGVIRIAGGGSHGLALKEGKVIAWGNNANGQCDFPAEAHGGVVEISCGGFHSLALKDGRVIAWGNNANGQCNVPAEAQSGVIQIAAGEYHSLALKDGRVIAWGDNEIGQCNVPAEAQSGVTQIAGGEYHSLALKDGKVIAWGYGANGQCNVPAEAQGGVTLISGGKYHSLALKDGSVIAWGNNELGQCNVPADAQSGVTQIAGGGFHSLALKSGDIAAAVIGPMIKANGQLNDVVINRGDNLSVTVQLDPGDYAGTAVDWWVLVCANGSWFYMDWDAGWTQQGSWSPVLQCPLFNLPPTPVLNISGLGAGLYTFYFAVDYPMDGILNVDGAILYDSVNVMIP